MFISCQERLLNTKSVLSRASKRSLVGRGKREEEEDLWQQGAASAVAAAVAAAAAAAAAVTGLSSVTDLFLEEVQETCDQREARFFRSKSFFG